MHSPASSVSSISSLYSAPLLSPPPTPPIFKFRHRVPTQVRRVLPLYVGFILFLLLVLNADILPSVWKPAGATSRQAHHPRSFPYGQPPNADFPKKIWQSWKVDPLHFEQRDFDTARSWTEKNPDHRYEVLTDNNDLEYVETHFGANSDIGRPDLVELYAGLTATIVKADLLRYMVMYAEGGVYADIDVEALRPVSRFVPPRYDLRDIDMVIGIEVDQPRFNTHPILGKKSESFCQWTFAARPRVPVLLRLVDRIAAWLHAETRRQGRPLGELDLDFDAVIAGTGPSAFTAALLEAMNDDPAARPVTWASHFHDMDESKLVSRVLVLNVEAFAAGQGHSDSGTHSSRAALVKHHYHASNWPSRHPRFHHPVYGPVEACNWDPPCVEQWDADVEAFEALSAEEKEERIRIRNEELMAQVE